MRRLLPLLLLCGLLLAGCVERRVVIRTEPAGAEVYVDGRYVGTSPVEMSFDYYGNHPIRIKKRGYKVLMGTLRLKARWFGKPGVDFFTENLYPGTIFDRREATFRLVKAERADADEAVRRAEEARKAFERFRREEKEKGDHR